MKLSSLIIVYVVSIITLRVNEMWGRNICLDIIRRVIFYYYIGFRFRNVIKLSNWYMLYKRGEGIQGDKLLPNVEPTNFLDIINIIILVNKDV